jgi:uncharacterized membrane protein
VGGSKVQLIVSGCLARLGYLVILVAMSIAQVSYILSLRQVSVVLTAGAGVILLRERYGYIRLLSSVFIFLGVYVLGVLA